MVMFGTRGKRVFEQNSKIGGGLDIMKVFKIGKTIQLSLISQSYDDERWQEEVHVSTCSKPGADLREIGTRCQLQLGKKEEMTRIGME